MAGVAKKNAVTVDVAAAARELAAGDPAPVDVFAMTRTACGLGHENPAGSRFCSSCGLPMDAPPPPGSDAAAVAEGRPKPGGQLDADEAAERARQHAETVAFLARAEQSVPDIAEQPDPSERKLRIHFVEDGFTWAGRVWNLGDELEIGPEHPRWEQALPWITLSKIEQVERYGRVFFEPGPWPYRQIAPGTEIPLPEAGMRRVQALRGGAGVPARGAADMPHSLIPL